MRALNDLINSRLRGKGNILNYYKYRVRTSPLENLVLLAENQGNR